VGRFVNDVLLISWLLLVALRDCNEKNINLLWMSTYVLYLFEARKRSGNACRAARANSAAS
jgi:hypothetical protein